MTQQTISHHTELLRCVRCFAGLHSIARESRTWDELKEPLHEMCLACSGCSTVYPVSADGIPLIWTEALQRCFQSSDTDSPLSANMSVYDDVSDDYAAHWRQDTRNSGRMKSAVSAALEQRDSSTPLRHIDVGCGPGHVLHWTEDLKADRFALDVSLSNLRNTLRGTGAFVVLGSADCIPFKDGVFDLVTQSSVLHHIERWEQAVTEMARICTAGGGLVIDCEPSRESKDWSRLATFVFQSRWYPYKLMSFFSARKFWFRDIERARLTFEQAEIHNRPNTGLPVDRIETLLRDAGFSVRVVRGPDERLEPKGRLSWQEMILHSLSGHSPFNSRYGWFTLVGSKHVSREG